MFVFDWTYIKLCFRCGNLLIFEHRLSSAQCHGSQTIFFSSIQVEAQNAFFIDTLYPGIVHFPCLFFCLTCSRLYIYTYIYIYEAKCQIHWETAVKMREGCFALVFGFAVFKSVVNRASC